MGPSGNFTGPSGHFTGPSGPLERTWCNSQTCSTSSPLLSFASQSEIVNSHIPTTTFICLILMLSSPSISKNLKGHSAHRIGDVTVLDQALWGSCCSLGSESSMAFKSIPGLSRAFEGLPWPSRAFQSFQGASMTFKGLQGFQGPFRVFYGFQGPSMVYHGLQGPSGVFHGLQGVPRLSRAFEGLPWPSRIFQGF